MLLDVSRVIVHLCSSTPQIELWRLSLSEFPVVGNCGHFRILKLREPCSGSAGVRPIPKPSNSDQLGIGLGSQHGAEILETFIFRPLDGPLLAHLSRCCVGCFANLSFNSLFTLPTNSISVNRFGLRGTALEQMRYIGQQAHFF